MKTLITAELSFVAAHYNTTVKATIPPCFHLEVVAGCEWIKDAAHFENRRIYAEGNTEKAVTADLITQLKARGLSGKLRITNVADQPKLEVKANWQTKARGTNNAEYQIYLSCADDGKGGDFTRGGAPLKTYDEWLAS